MTLSSSSQILLIITKNYPPAICGVGDHTFNLVKEFEKKGIRVIVFTGTENAIGEKVFTASKGFGPQMEQQLKELIEKEKLNRILWQYVPYSYQEKGLPFWWPAMMQKILNPGLEQFIFFHEVSLRLWGYGFKQMISGAGQRIIANRAAKIAKTIMTSIPLYGSYFWFKKPLIVPISANIKLADDCVELAGIQKNIEMEGLSSEAAGRRAISQGDEKGQMTAEEKEIEKVSEVEGQIQRMTSINYHPDNNREPTINYIFCFANRADNALLEAIKKLQDRHPVKLVLGGNISDEGKKRIENWIRNLNLENLVSITGLLPTEQLAVIIKSSKIFFQPQIVEHNKQGGISAKNGTIMSAMKMGKAIITSRGDMTDSKLFRNEVNMIFVPFGGTEAYTQALSKLLDDPDFALKLGSAARSTYEKYCSWKMTSDLIAKELEISLNPVPTGQTE
jgi:glycosyltransferase involved in cell wall biosynthesis